jgi:hypothetical protein
MRIVVTGLLGQYHFGGVIWDYVQYLLGFRKLGHEVWYLEDSGVWPYDSVAQTYTVDCSANVRALEAAMAEFGFAGRWIYRNGANGQFFGIEEKAARELVRGADLIANVSGAALLDDFEFGGCHRMFLDGDPMFTQINMDDPRKGAGARIRAHDSHFSFGLNIGAPDCLVPTGGLNWKRTVQPVDLDFWPVREVPPARGLTTVMNWTSYASCVWNGEDYGQKDVEFNRFLDLPSQVPGESFVLAMGQGPNRQRPTEMLREKQWTILEPSEVVPDHLAYGDFLSTSKGEWSIAKNGYVKSRSGWFSGRTACYLAAGRPAIVQETGWSRHIPAGQGLFAFETADDVARAAAEMNRDYAAHRRAARALAETHFEAGKVCQDLIVQAGLGT